MIKITFLTFDYICFTFVCLGLLLRTFHSRKKGTEEYDGAFSMSVGLKYDIVSINKWNRKEQNQKGKERGVSIYVTKILVVKIEKRCHVTWFISFKVECRMHISANNCQLTYLILCVCQAVAKRNQFLKVFCQDWFKCFEISMVFCKITWWGSF